MQVQQMSTHGEPGLEIRAREEQAFNFQDVLAHQLPSFHRRAYRYLGNDADAEDAVQDALLSAYKHLDQFRGEARIATWLTTIVSNSALMQLRRRRSYQPISLDEPVGEGQEFTLSEQLADGAPTPEDECRSSQLIARVRELLPRLSPSLRKTFELRDLDGLTTSEAAHFLGVAEGTVKAQLARARTKLRRLMREQQDLTCTRRTCRSLASTQEK